MIWLAEEPIPGSADAVARLRQAGSRRGVRHQQCVPTVAELQERLADGGDRRPRPDELVTSAQAAASMLEPGSTAVVCADGGVLEALSARGVTVVAEGPADAVVVGWTRRFDFDLLATAATAVRLGARFIGTNEDPTHPTPRTPAPGIGRDPGRGGDRGPGDPRGGRQAARPARGAAAGRVPLTPCSWWGTGPPPTGRWRAGSDFPSRWCARA